MNASWAFRPSPDPDGSARLQAAIGAAVAVNMKRSAANLERLLGLAVRLQAPEFLDRLHVVDDGGLLGRGVSVASRWAPEWRIVYVPPLRLREP